MFLCSQYQPPFICLLWVGACSIRNKEEPSSGILSYLCILCQAYKNHIDSFVQIQQNWTFSYFYFANSIFRIYAYSEGTAL